MRLLCAFRGTVCSLVSRPVRRPVYMISRLLAKLIYSLLGTIHIFHPERSASPGPCILAANHISHFDPPLISIASRCMIDWMAMKDLFKHPVVIWYFGVIGTFPTDRDNVDRGSVKTALTRLKMGRVVGMFPEGGIRTGATSVLEGAPMRPGSGALAQIANVPILPCVVLGTDRLYNRKSWRPFGRTPFWVGFGELIHPPSGLNKAEARAFLERELAAAFPKLLAEMRAHFSLTDDDIPKTPGERRRKHEPFIQTRNRSRRCDLVMCGMMNGIQMRHHLPPGSRAELEKYIADCESLTLEQYYAVPPPDVTASYDGSVLRWASPVRIRLSGE